MMILIHTLTLEFLDHLVFYWSLVCVFAMCFNIQNHKQLKMLKSSIQIWLYRTQGVMYLFYA